MGFSNFKHYFFLGIQAVWLVVVFYRITYSLMYNEERHITIHDNIII
jgi:hypothetical protein